MSAVPVADQFDGMIGPGQLLAWIRNATPWLLGAPAAGDLLELGRTSDGFRAILDAAGSLRATPRPSVGERDAYFALCLACHHATVGSFVPTDVDSKIRGVLWHQADAVQARRRWELVQASHGWSLDGVSTRFETSDRGPVSGHDGEWLAVCGGALATFLRLGDQSLADAVADAMEAELAREAAVFGAAVARSRSGKASTDEDLRLLRLAWILTHNAGDVDQGLSYADDRVLAGLERELAPYRARFAKLSHEGPQRFGGTYLRAKAIYQVVAAEGHRHYPLRALKCLRASATHLLPLPPCLESWGERVGGDPALSADAKGEVLAALATGIAKVPGQAGYQRAIHGLINGFPGGLSGALKRVPTAARRALETPDLRRHLDLSPVSFAVSLAKRTRAAIA